MKKKSILVVEDDDAIRLACGEILTSWGYDVRLAEHGEAALRALANCPDRPDLILLDSMMPQMSGEQFVKTQQNDLRLKDIPVVVMSALSELPPELQGKRLLKKPMELQDLLDAIQFITVDSGSNVRF